MEKEMGLGFVTLTLDVVRLADGGERILPTLAQLAINQQEEKIRLQMAEEDLEDALEAEEAAGDALETTEIETEKPKFTRQLNRAQQKKGMAEARIFNARLSLERIKQAKAEREELLPRSKPISYKIAITDYETVIDYEEGARVDRSGMPQLDTNKMMKLRLPEILLDHEGTLTTPHASRIWRRWMQETYPDENQIPNSSLLA